MKTECSNFLLDIVAHRIEWISFSDLVSLAVRADHGNQQIHAALNQCWQHGLLSRTMCNVVACDQDCPSFLAMPTNRLNQKLKIVQVKQLQANTVAEPTEIIGLGTVAAGLLGRNVPVIPHAERLAASLRMTRAFIRFAVGKRDYGAWRQSRSSKLNELASLAAQTDEFGNVRKVVVAPVRIGKRKLVRILKVLQRDKVSYEIW